MFARLARIVLVWMVGAWAVDRWLALRRGSRDPEPLRTLVVVDAPIDETWAILADIPLQPEWMREMRSVRMLGDGPTRAGSRGEATVRVLGITLRDPVTVTEFRPPERFAVRHEGLVTGRGLITLEPGADGTTTIVRWEEALVSPVFPNLAALATTPILRSIFQDDLHRLRRLVETGAVDG